MITTNNKTIGFLAGGVDACALWRHWIPYMNLPGSGYSYGLNAAEIITHDYASVQRLGFKQNLEAMQGLRQAGLKIIYDLDDFLWDVPDWNPSAKILREARFGYSVCLHHADVVTVSTYPLKRAVQKYHRTDLINAQSRREIPVIVCENKIDLRFVAPKQEREEFIVGWAGSDTHSRDFEIVLPVLLNVIADYPDVVFEFAGWMPPQLAHFPNVRFRHWTPVSEWMGRYPRWGWSIALAPLFNHPFNNSKSGNKMTEAGAAHTPCLASWEPPYADWCAKGDPDLKNLLCVSASSWDRKLRMLIEDDAQREYLGELAYKNVERNHSWSTPHTGWSEVFQALGSL